MSPQIAIVGMACVYPDIQAPEELWECVLAQRRAFRPIPPERLGTEYFSSDTADVDRTYIRRAGLIRNYEFDRVAFRVSAETYSATDLTHWLALDIASRALEDAGFPRGSGAPLATTGVLIGNTLAGEFSRAALLRGRWPYVSRAVRTVLANEHWPELESERFFESLEREYKSPFPVTGPDSLAGSLANTIAGRICNHFDFNGGGYTLDGACSSSLLAVANACSALTTGDLDMVIAGGVDLSLDPFELVGFARAGALTPDGEMRVFDTRSNGFLPGEGCGMIVLMRLEDAVAARRRIHALIPGWGIASDGHGGITRPEVVGQLQAIRRAYLRAGFGVHTVGYLEGHGTGTPVGDEVELVALTRAIKESGESPVPPAIGSIKANIGHTKAAAGIAGLIKAALAVERGIVPPATACESPRPELLPGNPLRVLRRGEPWRQKRPFRAGVSAMGFGGIDAHIVLEQPPGVARTIAPAGEGRLLSSAQNAELFLFAAADAEELRRQIGVVRETLSWIADCELTDLAAHLANRLAPHPIRAAAVAANARELDRGLAKLEGRISSGLDVIEPDSGIYLTFGARQGRLGFLFPGQGSPAPMDGGAMRLRFAVADQLYNGTIPQAGADPGSTAMAQPAIATAVLGALRVLREFGCDATVGCGHSLGELMSLHWAGALSENDVLKVAAARGDAMHAYGDPSGRMAVLRASATEAAALLEGRSVVVAGLNAPRQIAISGGGVEIAATLSRARAAGIGAVELPVTRAFHSPLMAAAAPVLDRALQGIALQPLRRTVLSATTGGLLAPDADLRRLLVDQLAKPVRFTDAISAAHSMVDAWIEVGPGHILSQLLREIGAAPAISLDAGGPSVAGFLHAFAAGYVLGLEVRTEALFANRFARRFDPAAAPRFFSNPCERPRVAVELRPADAVANVPGSGEPAAGTALVTVRRLVAARAGLPEDAVQKTDRLLTDLHLNSLVVAQLIAEAASQFGVATPESLTEYAYASVGEIAGALEEIRDVRRPAPSRMGVPGAGTWVRPFTQEWVERPLPRSRTYAAGKWRVLAPPDLPLRYALEQAFSRAAAGSGVLVWVGPQPGPELPATLLEAARLALADSPNARFVLVHQDSIGGSFARTLHLEAPFVQTRVVSVPPVQAAAEWVLAEARAEGAYLEARYDESGRRSVPVLQPLELDEDRLRMRLSARDVLLATGGGKGIAAECAAALALRSGVALALLGRSRPELDQELRDNLERFRGMGIRAEYQSADVGDAAAVREAVHRFEAALGPISGILHGAGANSPRLIAALNEDSFAATLAPKVQGLRNLLACITPSHLRVLLSFGSVIARAGLAGEADYALANEWLTKLTLDWGRMHPQCLALSVEWSIWSGAGMGQRLGRVDRLADAGISSIPVDAGVMVLAQLLDSAPHSGAIVVSGRLGDTPTIEFAKTELPLLRFVARPLVHYPGIELVSEAELSIGNDPYLTEHVVSGQQLVPAVVGLEAMAQAASALQGLQVPLTIERVAFNSAISMPASGRLVLRTAALREGERVQAVLRCDRTEFRVDHFRATLRPAASSRPSRTPPSGGPWLPLDPRQDLYGGMLFHQGRFQRVTAYRTLNARDCVAVVDGTPDRDWFGEYLPAKLQLGDPAARDAVFHAIQPCIPHRRLLPVAIDRLTIYALDAAGPLTVHAHEVASANDTYIWNLDVFDIYGSLVESWEGLRLRGIEDLACDRLAAPVLVPYLERRLGDLMPEADLAFAVTSGGSSRRQNSLRGLMLAEDPVARLYRRPDGKPHLATERGISISHGLGLSLAVSGNAAVACDIEPVAEHGTWAHVLGSRYCWVDFIRAQAGETKGSAATRVWTVIECLKKAGLPGDAPLHVVTAEKDRWIQFRTGDHDIFSWTTSLNGREAALAVAVLDDANRHSLAVAQNA